MPNKSIEKIEFACLCFDKSNQCVFGGDPSRFALSLKSNISLFPGNITIVDTESGSQIKDEKNELILDIVKIPGLSTLDYTAVFYIKCEIVNDGTFVYFNNFRSNLIKYLVEQRFGKIYVTKDDFSSILLNDLYFKINKVENLLRSYIVKHFAITEGVSSWFNHVIDSEATTRVKKRTYNEDVFSPLSGEFKDLVDTRIYLTDFEDIGNIIYSNSYGNFKAVDLIDKIKSSTDLEVLQDSVQNNIDRYFGNFKDIDFQGKWEFLKSVRHKVAHNGFISLEQKEKAENYLYDLSKFIEDKDNEKIGLITQNEDIDIEKREYVNFSNSQHYKVITKNELLKELASYQIWSNDIGREFLGLKNFLYNRLGGANYHIGKAWDTLEELEKEGYIEIVIWKDISNTFPNQKAIRIKKELPVYSF